MRRRQQVGLKALADAAGLSEPPTPYHLGFMLGPAHQRRRPHRRCGAGRAAAATDDEIEAARIAVAARQAQPRAQGARDARCSRRRWRRRRSHDRGDARPAAAACVGSRGLAQGRGRPGRQPARRALPPPRLRHRLGTRARAARAPARCARSPGVDIGAAVRAAVAGGHLDQGRRPRHGGGPDRGARQASTRSRRSSHDALARAARRPRASASALDIDGALTPAGVTDELHGAHRARRALRPGQSAAALRLPGPSREVRQGGGRGARALRAGGGRRLAPRCRRLPRRRPAAGRAAARSSAACRCTSPGTCAATPGAAATASSS